MANRYVEAFGLELEVGRDECYVLTGGNCYSSQNLATLEQARVARTESEKMAANTGCKLQIVKCVLSCEVVE